MRHHLLLLYRVPQFKDAFAERSITYLLLTNAAASVLEHNDYCM